MLTLVFGGSGSGKSDMAEKLILHSTREKRWYIATMARDGSAEGENRIARHRKLRQGKEFTTLEWSRLLPSAVSQWLRENPEPAAVLLEDLGNLVANELFAPGRDEPADADPDRIRNAIIDPVMEISRNGHDLVVVCDMIDEDGGIDTPEMKRYDWWMQTAQTELAAKAERLVEVIAGIPNWIKRPVEEEERKECSDH